MGESKLGSVWIAVACLVALGGCVSDEPIARRGEYSHACSSADDPCDDGNVCTFDACDTTAGSCTHTPIRNCCATAADCTAPNVCFGATCDTAINRCTFDPVPGCCRDDADCFDGDTCTHDQCNTATGECMTVPRSCYCRNDAGCNDGNVCTLDRCDPISSRCSFTPIPGCCINNSDCTDGDACTVDTCDTATNTCNAPTVVPGCCNFDSECDDGVVCTADTCNLTTHTCSASPITGCCTTVAECTDGSVCTTDSCDLATNRCDFTGIAGCCTVDAQCDDGNPCTTNTCVSSTCQTDAVAGCCVTMGDCDDGSTCTTDACVGNACTNAAIAGCCEADADCDDGDPCTGDTCFVTTCVYADVCPPDGGLPDGGTGLPDGAVVLPDGAVIFPDGGSGLDGSVPSDGAVADGAVSMDGAVGDGAVGDGAVGDGAVGDGAVGDGAIGDGAIGDGAIGDGAVGDAGPVADAGLDSGAGDRDSGRPGADAGRARSFSFGGGACSAAGDPSGGVPWLFALGLLWLGRRRAPSSKRRRRFPISILVLVFALLPSAARAEGFRLDRHRAPTLPEDLLWTERAAVGGDRSPFGRLTIDFADDPLVTRDETGEEHEVVVDHQLGIHLAGGLSLFDHLHMAVGLPIYLQSANGVRVSSDMEAMNAPSDWGVGDLALDLRWVTLDLDDPLELAIAATLTVPIGKSDALAADEALGFAPRVILSRAFPNGRGFASLSLGVALRGTAQYGDLSVGSEAFFTAGALVNVVERVGVTVELAGSTTFTDPLSAEQTPLEGTLGGRYEIMPGLYSGVGIGTGFTRGYGSPDVRVTGMLGYRGQSMARPIEPPPPVVAPEPEPTDRDGDGILDPRDECPTEPEDADGFEDEDGCPELDNDRDGLPDTADACPTEPEDADGFEDENGCPDPDNDQDSVLDADDECPLEAEDRDSFEDDNGCPDPDNDQDGILDPDDQCPLEAETVNGIDDADGCPDRVRVDRETNQIRILEPVFFATNSDRIQRRSFAMLNEIADILMRQPELGRVAIEGHTDSRGRDEYNKRLSQRRADSVVRYIASQGVPAERLEAHGYGEERPIASNDTRDGRAENRRVEFRLVDMAPRVEVPVDSE